KRIKFFHYPSSKRILSVQGRKTASIFGMASPGIPSPDINPPAARQNRERREKMYKPLEVLLKEHAPLDATEAQHVAEALVLLAEKGREAFRRENLEAHF